MTEDDNLRIRRNDIAELEKMDTISFFMLLESFEARLKLKAEMAKSKAQK